MRCGACGRDVRSTSLALVLPLNDVKRVCDDCKRHGITIVSRTVTTQPAPAMTEQEATTRNVLRALAKQLKGLAEAYASPKGSERPGFPSTVADSLAIADALARWTAFTQAAEVATAWAERSNIRTEVSNDNEKEVPHG